MNKINQIKIILSIAVVFVIAFFLLFPEGKPDLSNYESINRPANIYPDYSGIFIPPNIAPLNFIIREEGKTYFIRISSDSGDPIEVSVKDSKVVIPFDKWKELLLNNRGKDVNIEIFARQPGGKWGKFKNIRNNITDEDIDGWLAYRLIHPAHNIWKKVGIYQRNLQNFDEKPILLNRVTDGSCMNCHSFCNNDPNFMLLHLRAGPASGTLIKTPGKSIKVNTATDFNKAGSYPSWHPSGKMIAMSANQLTLFFHAVGESRDVVDHASDLIVYNLDSNMITTCAGISDTSRMETFPAWSPDGNYLYFCSAPRLESYIQNNTDNSNSYKNIKYDLMRIRYYNEDGRWGKLDTVLLSSETGLSITEPRVSPDGRYLLFTMSEYGNFPIYLKSSDIYLLDLKTGKFFMPDVNSGNTDSFHSWSSNSRWFVFASKRDDGFCARLYFSYLDKNGTAHKPFLLPQEDPEFYDNFLYTYNVPELIKGPINYSAQDLTETLYNPDEFLQAKLDPSVKTREAVKKGLKLSPQ